MRQQAAAGQSPPFDALVIGAGQAGLAAGHYLRQADLRFALLEAGAEAHGSWARYYDSLRLFSTATLSALPGRAFGGDPQHYPTRDQVQAYLTSYARQEALPIIANAEVVEVTRRGALFEIVTARGACYTARSVIAATGSFARPYLPSLPGAADFQGCVLHAVSYRQPEPFRGQRVVIVGAGNSAVQIGIELAEVARVTLATRRPIQLIPQEILGRNVFAWVALTRLDRVPWGHIRRLPDPRLVFDPGGYRAALRAGRPNRRPMFQRLVADGVVWASGAHEPVDSVIFATGYRPNLNYLAALDALDQAGEPRQRAGVSTTTPGLYYLGLTGQRTFISGSLRGVGFDAAYVVKHLKRSLWRQGAAGAGAAGP